MSDRNDDKVVFRKQDKVGANDAEEDREFLAECFVDTGDLALLRDCSRPERIVLGRTGIGKSALLLKLLEAEPRAREIRAENLALSFISNSTILQFFEGLGVNLGVFYKLIWRHAFCVELLRMRFGLAPGRDRVSLIERVKAMFRGEQFSSAISYLEKWGDRFWEETEHRIKEITTKVEETLKSSISAEMLELGMSADGAMALSEEMRSELVQRGQRVVNEAHVPQLNQLLDLLHAVLDDEQKRYYLVIDRLDEEWVDERLRYKLIMALIETVKDFRRVENVKIVISLRLDLLHRVFARARTAGFQEEKLHSLYLKVSWNKHQLTSLIDSRVNRIFRDRYSASKQLSHADVLVSARRSAPPLDYILERTFMRPRDVIAFFNACIRAAEGKARINFKDIRAAEAEYSQGRLQSIADEWHAEYPWLNVVARAFLGGMTSPAKARQILSDERIEQKCIDIATMVASAPSGPLYKACEMVANGDRPAFFALQATLSALHRVGVVGLKLAASEPHSWYHETGRRVDPSEIGFDISVAVHPMFWSALQVLSASRA